MPSPPSTTRDQFLDATRRSGLLPPDRLGQLDLAAVGGAAAGPLADQLVAAGELTRFQADKLLLGQWSGLVLGKYRILAPLGRGGMGVVYLAREHSTTPGLVRPLIALKILAPKKAKEARVLDRFQREMAIGRFIPHHGNVARMYAAGEVRGVSYIAMEYAPGRTVKEIVAEDGPMRPGEAARVFGEIAEGLASVHNVGLIHRDVKPANIIVTPAGTAKLIDFGFALQIGDDLPRDPSLVGGRGYILGSMDYIAPEQATDATDVSPRSDLYALGASLYFALSSCPPFPGGTAIQKIRWHRHDSPPPIRTLSPGLPIEMAAVVSKLMAKDPLDRFASAVHVAEVLKQWATPPLTAAEQAKMTEDEEHSTDELWIPPETEPREDELFDADEGPKVKLPPWTPYAVGGGIGVMFVVGFLLRLVLR